MVSDVLYASKRMDWGTPGDFYAMLDAEFGFTLDPCATDENALCENYYTKQDDGLRQAWHGVVYVNPPYGKEIGRWARKCYESAAAGATVVLLIPARTDTAYWHDWVMRAAELRFVRGRLTFAGAAGAAPFPSAVAVFRPGCDGPPRIGTTGRRLEPAGPVQAALR